MEPPLPFRARDAPAPSRTTPCHFSRLGTKSRRGLPTPRNMAAVIKIYGREYRLLGIVCNSRRPVAERRTFCCPPSSGPSSRKELRHFCKRVLVPCVWGNPVASGEGPVTELHLTALLTILSLWTVRWLQQSLNTNKSKLRFPPVSQSL